MIITGIIGFLTKNLTFSGIISTPPAPVFFDIDISGVFSQGLYTVVFAFLLVTIFDTTGTMIGVAEQGGFMKNGKFLRVKPGLLDDATATTVVSMFGTSPARSEERRVG